MGEAPLNDVGSIASDVAVLRPRRQLRASGSAVPRRITDTPSQIALPSRAVVGYLSDFVVVDGAQTLLDQASRLNNSRYARGGLVARYIDSGCHDDSSRVGPALLKLIRDAPLKGYDAVLVDTVARFAPDLMTAFRAALAIIEAGLAIYEVETGRLTFEADVAARIEFGAL